MKILMVNKYLYPRGGCETYMFGLAECLKQMGISVAFWGMKSDKNIVKDEYNCFADDIDYKQMGLKQKISKSASSIYSIKNRKKISTILDEFKPDIVHLHNFNFQLTPAILPVIKKRNAKIVYTAHDSQLVCPYHRLYNFQKNTVCEKCITGKFYNCLLSRCFDNSLLKSAIGTVEAYLYHTLNYYNKYLDMIIVPSNFLANKIRNKYKGDIRVLPNYADIKINPKNYTKNDRFLYVGRISPEKGIVNVIDVFNELKLPLDIVGSGENAGDELSREYVRYLGPRYGQELLDTIAQAKFVIQPSVWYENCPMVVIESFACGTPVIAPAHSGFLEMIKNEHTGFFVDFTDKNKLKTELPRLAKIDISDMIENCLDVYRNRYSKEVALDKIISVYRELIDTDG